ncbi:MAG: LamG-like jellyroll fold domain-containing protein, partial [Promethearchaeota archaeon]
HHLNGLSGTHYDSTGNNHDGVSFNFDGDEPTSGKIDGAYNFDGINDAINLSLSHPQLYDDFTLSGWYKSTDASLSDDQYIWNHLEGYTETGIVMGVTDDTGEVGHIRLSIYDNSYNFHPYYGTSNIVDQEYHFVVMVRDNGSIKLYVDGNLELDTADLDTGETITVDASTGPFIGDCPGDTEQVKGVLDEIRVSTIGRSINWILTEFNNQYSPDTFYSIGLEEQVGGNVSSEGYTFTTNSNTSVTIGLKLSLGVQRFAESYADDFSLGTSFSIENGSLPIWTASVMVSPPPEIDALSFRITYPEGEWWPFSVKTPSGIEMTFGADWTCFDGELIVGSSAINEYGMWKIQFLDRNHILDFQMGQAGGPYSQTNEFTIGQDMQYRVQSSGTIGSAISLELTDPSGSVWYSGSTTFQGTRFSLPYYHRKQITISHENVAGDLVNFPVLVDIYDPDLRTDVRSDGRDIAFAIGEETLVHEIESFDREFNLTHAHIVAWVKVPLLSGSSDTVISMYYGNPLAPIVYSSGPVWDSGYLGVWHLSESGTGALNEYQDSSQYMHHGQGGEGNTSFVPTQVAGKIGRGQDFNNLDGYYDLIDCGDSPLWNLDGYQITLQAWVQHDITPNTHVYGIMNHKGWYDGYSLFVNYGGGSTLKPTFCLPGQTHQLRGANDVTGGTWHHIVATYDGSLMRIYVDGVQDPNVLAKSDAILPSAYEQGFWIGHGDQPKDKVWSAEWDGQIDEVRISDVVRSSGWIQTEFQNQDDPSGFCLVGAEEAVGYSESASILLDSSASAGVWQATARYRDRSAAVDHRVGIISRTFVVKRASTLNLVAPGDAVSDWTTSKLIGEELYVEYELSDALTATPIDGATITLNWTVDSSPVDVQLNDYGDGSYGKALNTTDLGAATRWRIELVASHQFYSNATSVLFLDLSHQTFITYAPPQSTAFGDDFNVKLTLRDAFSNMPVTSAGFTSNGTLLGIPVSYGNGTYLLTIDSSLLAIGTHTFRITATPTDSYLLTSSIDVQINYREIYTDAYPVASDPTEIPWGEEASVTVQWNDLDNSGIGIEGGTLSIIQPVTIQTLDAGSGEYFVAMDLASYLPGTYVFELVISKANYQDSTIFVTIVVRVHRTSVSADYEPQTPVGTSTQFNLTFLDIDGGSSGIDSGNLSYIEVDWGSGPQTFSSYSFWLDTSTWIVGVYTINITVYSEAAPRYYLDATIAVELVIRKIEVYISWDHLEPFPNGDDFVIVVHLNISEPGTSIDGNPIDGLPQARFSARNDTGSLYALKGFTALGDGAYELVIDEGIFKEGNYIIIVYVDFLSTDDYFDTQTPSITFTYRPILTFLSSENYPTVTTTYDTNVTITLNYVDIDNGANITTGVVTAEGASIQWQHLGNGIYEVIVVVQGWDLGSYEVNITLDAVSYQAKTLTFEVLVQIAYAYARSSISSIDLPVGDIAIFYVDYWDIVHDEPILEASVGHNWIHSLTVTWTGTQYRIELPSYDTDGLASYFIMFNVSKGLNYQIGYFNISLTLRTHYTEYRLASAVEPTTYLGMVNVSLYYGDLDNNAGILSQFVNASVYGESGWIESLLLNDTVRGDGFYIVRFAASVLGESGIYNFTVYFNWTGAIQKFQNGMIRTSVRIIGEESDLSLDDSPGPTP